MIRHDILHLNKTTMPPEVDPGSAPSTWPPWTDGLKELVTGGLPNSWMVFVNGKIPIENMDDEHLASPMTKRKAPQFLWRPLKSSFENGRHPMILHGFQASLWWYTCNSRGMTLASKPWYQEKLVLMDLCHLIHVVRSSLFIPNFSEISFRIIGFYDPLGANTSPNTYRTFWYEVCMHVHVEASYGVYLYLRICIYTHVYTFTPSQGNNMLPWRKKCCC